MSASLPFGEQLRERRVANGLTLEALAETSGVSARTLSDIERGVSATPQRRTVEAIARGLTLEGDEAVAFVRLSRVRRQGTASAGSAAAAPIRIADFSGRELEVGSLVSLLSVDEGASGIAPVIIISGAPGMGKTTSALEALERVSEIWPRVVFVDLNGFSPLPLSPLEVMQGLLRQVTGVGNPTLTTLEAATLAWQAITTETPTAVVLDNAASEAQVRPVLSSNQRGAVVVTSRRSLAGLEGASRVVLGPLDPADGELLLRRLIPEGQHSGTDLSELARLCDDVPLALRVAGKSIASDPRVLTADYNLRMRSEEDRLRLLVDGDLGVEAAIALSYDALDATTAATFRAISIIDGTTFNASTAAAAAGTDELTVEMHLDELTDLGLLEARGGDRYRLHDLLRLFASGRLRDVDGADGVAERRTMLRDWLLGTLERAGAWYEANRLAEKSPSGGMSFADADSAGAWIRQEAEHWWPALRAAAAAGDHATVVDTSDALHWFSELWLDWGQWHAFFSLSAQSAAALNDPVLEATHLGYLSWAEMAELGDYPTAFLTARRALEAADRADDDVQRGWAQMYIAWSGKLPEQSEDSHTAALAAAAAFARAGDTDGEAQARVMIAAKHYRDGEHHLAIAEYEGMLGKLHADAGRRDDPIHKITEISLLEYLAGVQLAAERYEDVLVTATAGLNISRSMDADARIAQTLRARAAAHLALGNEKDAREDIAEGYRALGTAGRGAYLDVVRKALDALVERMDTPS